MPSVQINLYSPTEEDEMEIVEPIRRNMMESITNLSPQLEGMMYSYANGVFDYDTIGNSKKQNYELKINTKWDALLFAKMILDPSTIKDNKLKDKYARILALLRTTANSSQLIPQFGEQFGRWFPEVGNNTRVINPLTNRNIALNGQTFRKVFGRIILRDVVYSDISNFNLIDYPIDKYCVPSYFKTKKMPKDFIKELNSIKTPSVDQLIDLLDKYPKAYKSYKFYDMYGNVKIEKDGIAKRNGAHKFQFCIHNSHLYVLKTTLNKSKKTKFLPLLEWRKMKEELQKTCDLVNHNDYEFMYEGIKYKQENFDSISKIFGYLGFIQPYTRINIEFYNSCGIRSTYYKKFGDVGNVIDINNAFVITMRDPTKMIILQTGKEYTEKYNNETIEPHYFYKTNMKGIFFPEWVTGFTIKRFPKHFKKRKIKYVMKGTGFTYGNSTKIELSQLDNYYKQEAKEWESGEEKYVSHMYRLYSGICARYRTNDVSFADCSDETECEALKLEYNVDIREKSDIRSKQVLQKSKHYYKKHCGVFAYLSIIQHTKNDIFQLHCDIRRKYPKAKLRAIRTDSLQYNIQIKNVKSTIPHKYEKEKVKKIKYDETRICGRCGFNARRWLKKDWIIDNEDPRALLGYGGLGKSYHARTVILPKHKPLITSSTVENASDWSNKLNSKVLNLHQHLLKRDGMDEIIKKLDDYDCILVDEVGQLTFHMIYLLQILKMDYGKTIFAIGDDSQCDGMDGNVIDNQAFMSLVDYKVRWYKDWHPQCRFKGDEGKKYFDFLMKFKNPSSGNERWQLLKDNITFTDEIGEVNICFNNGKTRPDIYEEIPNAITCNKVQGKTIEENVVIHQMSHIQDKLMLNLKQAYVALSRVISFGNIKINTKDWHRSAEYHKRMEDEKSKK